MDKSTARALLQSLLERYKRSSSDVFLTSLEVKALQCLLDVEEPEFENTPIVAPQPKEVAVQFAEIVAPNPDHISDEYLMCLDFGTSLSKAFACSTDELEEVPELFPLSFGKNEFGNPRLLLPSELFVDGGRLYLGTAARARFDSVGAPQDRLIDSPKQFMTLNENVIELDLQKLNETKDPTQNLTKRDALVLYLAHLNLRSEASLQEQGLSIDLKRRYAHPAWNKEVFEANSAEMRRIMAEAIAIGRCCGDEISDSLSVERARLIAQSARAAKDQDLPYALVGDPVFEATAAGAGALIGTPAGTRLPYVILDIGAGTTDAASCRCIHDALRNRIRVTEVLSGRGAINQAGNIIDNVLLKLIMEKSPLVSNTPEYEQVQAALKRTIRSNKEILFNEGNLAVGLVTGDVIELELDELLAHSVIINLFEKITDLVANAAFSVAGDDEKVKVAATGGGASLPVVKAFDGMWIQRNSKHIQLSLVNPMPDVLEDPYPELRDPYPQIAVAVGGALPNLPDQVPSTPEITPDPGSKVLGTIYKS